MEGGIDTANVQGAVDFTSDGGSDGRPEADSERCAVLMAFFGRFYRVETKQKRENDTSHLPRLVAVVTVTAGTDSSRCRYRGNRRIRQLALDSIANGRN